MVAATPRVDRAGGAALLLEEELSVAGDASGEVGRQRQSLVERIRVQRLGVALRRGHGLDAGADDVAVDILRRQRPPARLAVGPQRQRLRVLRIELLHELRPQQTGRPELRDLHEEVHADAPEETEARRELVDAEPGVDPGPHVLHAVGEGVGQLQIRRRARFLHVVTGDRDRVEPRHLLRREGEDVGDDPHARRRWVDVGVADHELLEDVVLDGPGQLYRFDALLLGRHNVEREDRQHCTVHRHRHTHLVERDAVEEPAHVEDRVDCDARHPHVARHPGVVGVVAAVGGEVERDREPLLAPSEVATVERVGFLRGREPGVLADRPRLVDVHRRIRTPKKGRKTRKRFEEVETGDVVRGRDRGDVDPLRCLRHETGHRARENGLATVEGDRREVGDHAHPLHSTGHEVADRRQMTRVVPPSTLTIEPFM